MREIIRKVISKVIAEGKMYFSIDEDEFEELLTDLSTLDLEDDQVRYPELENVKEYGHFISSRDYDAFLLNKEELPSSGPFEIIIEDKDETPIGFIRGTKGGNIVSINLIHIMDGSRGYGIGTEIYEEFLNKGLAIKSDSEITDATHQLYIKLMKKGYNPIKFEDGTVGLKK